MAKWHVKSNGDIGKCKAWEGVCPYESNGFHFYRKDDAILKSEEVLKEEFGSVVTVKKDKKSKMWGDPKLDDDEIRTTDDPELMMRAALSGRKKHTLALVDNPNATPEALTEAIHQHGTMATPTRMRVEMHPNTPAFALTAPGVSWLIKHKEDYPNWSEKFFHPTESNDYRFIFYKKGINPDRDSKVFHDGFLKLAKNFHRNTSVSPQGVNSFLKKSYKNNPEYTIAAAENGGYPNEKTFPNSEYEPKPDNETILLAIPHVKDGEKLRETCEYMEKSADMKSIIKSYKGFLKNANTPADVKEKIIKNIKELRDSMNSNVEL